MVTAVGAVEGQEPAKGKALRVLLTYGGHGFKQKPFFAMFDALPNVEYTKAPMPKSADLLKPGLEKDYDVIVMYDMVKSITPAQRKAFVDLLNTGIGVVSLHHNLCAHGDWGEFRNIIGGKWIRAPETIDGEELAKSTFSHDEDVKVTVTDENHPITRGLKDFVIHDETYGSYYTSPKVRVLMKTDHAKNDPEVAWVTGYGKSRVFYFMFGHGASGWRNPNYSEILLRGIRWAAGRED